MEALELATIYPPNQFLHLLAIVLCVLALPGGQRSKLRLVIGLTGAALVIACGFALSGVVRLEPEFPRWIKVKITIAILLGIFPVLAYCWPKAWLFWRVLTIGAIVTGLLMVCFRPF